MLRIELIKVLRGLKKKKKKLLSHSSVYKAKNLANKEGELELLPDEHGFDLPGFIKESRGWGEVRGGEGAGQIHCEGSRLLRCRRKCKAAARSCRLQTPGSQSGGEQPALHIPPKHLQAR